MSEILLFGLFIFIFMVVIFIFVFTRNIFLVIFISVIIFVVVYVIIYLNGIEPSLWSVNRLIIKKNTPFPIYNVDMLSKLDITADEKSILKDVDEIANEFESTLELTLRTLISYKSTVEYAISEAWRNNNLQELANYQFSIQAIRCTTFVNKYNQLINQNIDRFFSIMQKVKRNISLNPNIFEYQIHGKTRVIIDIYSVISIYQTFIERYPDIAEKIIQSEIIATSSPVGCILSPSSFPVSPITPSTESINIASVIIPATNLVGNSSINKNNIENVIYLFRLNMKEPVNKCIQALIRDKPQLQTLLGSIDVKDTTSMKYKKISLYTFPSELTDCFSQLTSYYTQITTQHDRDELGKELMNLINTGMQELNIVNENTMFYPTKDNIVYKEQGIGLIILFFWFYEYYITSKLAQTRPDIINISVEDRIKDIKTNSKTKDLIKKAIQAFIQEKTQIEMLLGTLDAQDTQTDKYKKISVYRFSADVINCYTKIIYYYNEVSIQDEKDKILKALLDTINTCLHELNIADNNIMFYPRKNDIVYTDQGIGLIVLFFFFCEYFMVSITN